MCGFSFTVFLSAFQLLPTAPFHILALGGTAPRPACSSASSPTRRRCRRRSPAPSPIASASGGSCIVCAPAITVFSAALRGGAVVQVMLALVLGARRVLVGPAVGLRRLRHRHRAAVAPRRRPGLLGLCQHPRRRGGAVDRPVGVRSRRLDGCCVSRPPALNLIMAFIAWRLPPDRRRRRLPALSLHPRPGRVARAGLGVTLFLYSFSYGGITSFVAHLCRAGRRHAAGALLHGLLPSPSSPPGRSSPAMPTGSATRG